MRQHVITPLNVQVYFDRGDPVTLPRSAPNAGDLIKVLSLPRATDEAIRKVASIPNHLAEYGRNRLSFLDELVLLDGIPLDKEIAHTVRTCYETGAPFSHFIQFWTLLQSNKRTEAIDELKDFLQHRGMPITPKGHFLGYKGVDEDYWSVRGNPATRVIQGKVDASGRILNSIGATIEVNRDDVCPNRAAACGSGLHVGSLDYAKGHGPRVVIVSINPADVVSIPSDSTGQKLRACKYKVVSDYAERMPDGAVKDEDNPYDVYTPTGIHRDDTKVAVVRI